VPYEWANKLRLVAACRGWVPFVADRFSLLKGISGPLGGREEGRHPVVSPDRHRSFVRAERLARRPLFPVPAGERLANGTPAGYRPFHSFRGEARPRSNVAAVVGGNTWNVWARADGRGTAGQRFA
jgi:hypothetical protein